MSEDIDPIYEIVVQDPRYPIDAYTFALDALAFAGDAKELSCDASSGETREERQIRARRERHLTGQQFCDAIRLYSIHQFGYMAKTVLKSWGITNTSCFGDIVYNMIKIGIMKKSSRDRRSHFNDVYDFDDVFEKEFEFCCHGAPRRSPL